MNWLAILIIALVIWLYWRYYYFFRNPRRKIPSGKNIVSPADGRVVYVKKVSKSKAPISIKGKRQIKLEDITKTRLGNEDKYLIGIFMTPLDVHFNRAPIAGKIKFIRHYKNKLLPMTKTWINCILNKKPYYNGADYLLENERKAILIEGVFQVLVVQIADMYVRKIVSFVKDGDIVNKGDRIGLIRMGSQVDLVLPYRKNIKIKVKEGDKVKAGSSIVAEY